MLYDFLVIRQLVPVNPAASVRGQSMWSMKCRHTMRNSRTTKLYDRRGQKVLLEEWRGFDIERHPGGDRSASGTHTSKLTLTFFVSGKSLSSSSERP
jgi:hypothetical protein